MAVASDGEEALRTAWEQPPDLVVLDIMMPGLDGIEVCRRLREGDPSLPILLLTAKDAPADEVVGLDAGADDYVTKPFSFEVLSARVRALLRRRETERGETLQYGDLRMDVGARLVQRGERSIELTTTEFNLLHFLLAHPRQVLGKEQIMERVWGYDFGGNGNIVEVYVGSLRKKLEAEGQPRLIQTVRSAGYVLREA